MDDPWGSPWAEETRFENAVDDQGKDASFITVQTPGKTAPLDFQQTTNSPWGDEDEDEGFGDWATVPSKDTSTSPNDADFSWDYHNDAQSEVVAPSKDNISPGWNSNISVANDPQFTPDPILGSAVRHHSPDPWKIEHAETTDQVSNIELINPEGQGRQSTGAKDSIEESTSPSDNGEDNPVSPVVFASNQTESEGTLQDATTKDRTSQESGSEAIMIEEHRAHSRRSSSPSFSSQHGDEEVQLETPRTSMDDDPRRPQLPRKVSAKLQPLVQHFDALSEDSPSLGEHLQKKGIISANASIESTDDENQIREHDEQQVHQPLETKDEVTSYSPTSKEKTVSTANTPIPSHGQTQNTTLSTSDASKKFLDPVNIDIDVSLLDALFPDNGSKDVEDLFIPDTVPFESFSSTEQRKSWYRISRYGSMRKHNSGDDENYSRVSWLNSTIRDDTLKIVARWMEEDRLNGQVMLGGSGRTSVLFGWGDAKSPPVSVEAAFASKENKRLSTARHSIPMHQGDATKLLQQVNPNGHHHASQGPVDVGSQHSESITPVASFGWSSDDKSKMEANSFPPPPRSLQSTTENDAVRQKQLRPVETVSASRNEQILADRTHDPVPEVTSNALKEKTAPTSVLHSQHIADELPLSKPNPQPDVFELEEDDWGDMVSSSAIEGPSNPSHASTSKLDNAASENSPANILGQSFASKAHEAEATLDLASMSQSTVSAISTTTAADGWASADFSFFDATPKATTQQPPPPQKSSISKLSRPSPLKQVTFSELPQNIQNNQNTTIVKPEVEQEKIVRDIIKNLPDLSYMFRK